MEWMPDMSLVRSSSAEVVHYYSPAFKNGRLNFHFAGIGGFLNQFPEAVLGIWVNLTEYFLTLSCLRDNRNRHKACHQEQSQYETFHLFSPTFVICSHIFRFDTVREIWPKKSFICDRNFGWPCESYSRSESHILWLVLGMMTDQCHRPLSSPLVSLATPLSDMIQAWRIFSVGYQERGTEKRVL